jgi:hypothetical protein
MPVLAQERWTDGRSLGRNWHYSDLGGITAISKLENQQLQNAVSGTVRNEFQIAVMQSCRRPSPITSVRYFFASHQQNTTTDENKVCCAMSSCSPYHTTNHQSNMFTCDLIG